MITKNVGGAPGGTNRHPVTPSHSSPAASSSRCHRRRLPWPYWLLILNILQTILVTVSVSGLSLNSFISYYEPVYYNTSHLADQVHRSSRSKRSPSHQDQDQAEPTNRPSQFKFQFQAHKKLFRVNLEGSAGSIFSPDAEFLSTTGKINFDTSKVVNGFLEDDSESHVDGIIRSDGIFDGHIQTKDDIFYIEPAERYFGESAEFPVVIYSHSDVDGPSDYGGGGIGSLLTRRGGVSSLSTRRSTILNNSSVISHSLPVSHKRTSTSIGSGLSSNSQGRRSEPLSSAPTTSGHQQRIHDSKNYVSVNQVSSIHPVKNHSKVFDSYSDNSIVNNDLLDNHGQQHDGHLDDRLGGHLDDFLDGQRPLDLGDQYFENLSANDIFRMSETQANAFKKVRENVSGGQRSKVRRAATFSRRQSKTSDRKKTTCMLYLQADHLFYKNMGRSEEACIEVMTRHVQRVNSIYRSIDFDLDGKPDNISFMIKRVKVHTDEALKDPTYRFPDNYGVEKFLEIFSEEDYDAFCLAYMFTYRDFEGGTLGLAWTGDLKNAGGVCEKNGHYRGSFKSLNTGVITLLNYGKHVPPAVSHVTMAHEMGHNFGSPHDPETISECVPGGEEGNYIMFARATSGDKMNNKKFSPCSLDSISKVLEAKARGRKGCFKEPQMAICGNGVVEEGEECDCGWEEDCLEDCCWPQRTKYSINQLPCTLKPQKTCSPSQGPCCSRECSYTRGNRCREDNGCRDDSYCNGSGTECPASLQKPNKTVCNEEFVCFQGECTGSICLAYGMESCQCEQRPGDQDTRSCELCCKLPGEENPCLSSFELNTSPLDIPDMLSKPGTPCNNYQGYCDVFQKCREVDPDGPLATLRKILLSDQSIASLKRFLQNYWYSAVLAVIAIIALMITIVRFCGKKTPLVHRRRRKRHRSVHHGQDVESGGNGPRSMDNMTTHPTTMKSLIPILGGGKANRRRQSGDRSRSNRSKRRRDDQLRSVQIESEDSPARKLAKGLTNLIVALPPESRDPDQDDQPGDQEQRSHPKLSKLRSKSMEEKSSKYKGNSRIKKHKTIGHMKKLSKSATTLSKSFEKLSGSGVGAGGNEEGAENSATVGAEGKKDDGVGGRQKQRRISKSADKSKSRKTSAKVEPDPTKEVTIAKLGPFKMSMEVRGESMSPGRKHVTHQESAAKATKNGDNNKQRKRKTGSTSKADPADDAIEVDKKDSGENNSDNIKSVQTKVKKEKSRKEKDKVIVSKMAKSDRPHRERSPEKSKELRTINENTDYRLSLNKPSTTTSTSTLDRKPNRSISQPNPPSNLAELTHAYYSSSSHSSRISAINKKQLKRSSTAREQLSEAATAERIPRVSEKSNTLLRPNNNSKQKLSNNNDLTVFDNLGYDKSPSGLGGSGSESLGALGTSGNSSNNNTGKQRQRRVSSGSHSLSEQLREQLESQLRREKNSSNYSLMELTSLSDSDCSSEDKRKSPPTQTQSLSEESSTEAGSGSAGCNTGRRTARNSLVNPFTWEDTDNSEGDIMAGIGAGDDPSGAWPGGPQDVPMSGWEGAKGKGRAGGVEMDDVGWDTEDEGVPQFGASNMFVRLPNSLLLQQSPDSSLQGCELKTDPLNEHTAAKPVRVDNINDDIDTISIMTDGMDSSLNNHTSA